MTEDKKIAYIIAIYGLMQKVLKSHELIDERGKPIKIKLKHLAEHERDAVTLYDWFAQTLKRIPESKLNTEVRVFNAMAKALSDDYMLNLYLLGLFMTESLMENDMSPLDKNMIMPKVERMIKHVRQGIKDANEKTPEDGIKVIYDSKICASNIHRTFSGQAELTKDMRAKNRAKWKEALRNKPKQAS